MSQGYGGVDDPYGYEDDGDDGDPYGEEDNDENGASEDGSGDPIFVDIGVDGVGEDGSTDSMSNSLPLPTSAISIRHRKMMKRVRQQLGHSLVGPRDENANDAADALPLTPSPTIPVELPTGLDGSDGSSTDENVMSGTDGVAANARKTSSKPAGGVLGGR